MIKPLLVCTDLDRTLLPNGIQEESPAARALFRQLVDLQNIVLVYVSGRHLALVQDAIRQWNLPVPDFIIADVGSTLYQHSDNHWQLSTHWQDEISPDWKNFSHAQLQDLLKNIGSLQLQEDEKQNRFKLSYYLDPQNDVDAVVKEIDALLRKNNINAGLIWSIDETSHTGLLDILPASANKLHAIRFLARQLRIPRERIFFSGDSGNDLPVIISNINAVLVRNATEQVKQLAVHQSQDRGNTAAMYVAKGDFAGMNGYYAAGIIEGLAHYYPEIADLIDQHSKT